MKINYRVILFFIAIFIIMLFQYSPSGTFDYISLTVLEKTGTVVDKTSRIGSIKPDINYGSIPLYFIHNEGQVNKNALFYAKTPGYTLWVTKEGLVFDSIRTQEAGARRKKAELRSKEQEVRSQEKSKTSLRDISRLIFIGANKDLKIEPLKAQKLKVNYFKGNDKSKWVGGVPTSGAVVYRNVYKNIDLKVYGIGKQIEYDWIVKPGGDPSDIKFEYKNVKIIKINRSGDLDIKTQFGTLIHKKPYAYQRSDAGANGNSPKTEVVALFKKAGKNTFGFKIEKYDKSRTLTIDPIVLAYSTYLGGNDWDSVMGIAVDSSGSAYVTGSTQSTDFPTLNRYQENQPWEDVFVTKLSPSGNSLVYSTYLGGNAGDYVIDIAIDSSGSAYVTGPTHSTNFPTLNQYQGYQGSNDAFITKISPSGNSLLYSTYLGGNSNSESTIGIAVDSSGSAYVTGYTYSTDFPTLNPYQGNEAYSDAFVTKFSPAGNSLVYSTYLGGSSSDGGKSIAIDPSGSAYVTGSTQSTDFPVTDPIQGYQGGRDIFVTKLSPSGNSLIYSTYLGGNNVEEGRDITVDFSGSAYVTGYTYSTDFPTLNQFQGLKGIIDAFVTKLSPSGNSLVYSTYLGGNSIDSGISIAVDSSGSAFVTGNTFSTDFPILNQFQGYQGGGDAFITKLSPSGNSLVYSTYLGGNGINEGGRGIAVESSGFAYVTGYTDSTDFPTLNQFQGYQGGVDAFVTKLYPNQVFFKVIVSVSGEGGKVDKLLHKAVEGKNVVINIFPDEGFEIDRIIDNGLEMPVSNPYIIYEIDKNHKVEIIFKKILYPPTLELTGIRKTETAWIIKRDYTELKISITEHISPMVVSSYILYKSISGIWVETQRYNTPGNYTYSDKFFKPGENISYKLTAVAPDGSIVAETNILTL